MCALESLCSLNCYGFDPLDTKSIKRWYEMLKEKMQRNKRHVREHLVGTGIPPIRHSMNYKGGGVKFTPSREVPLVRKT
ncbi:hypothetical protein TNCV_1233181 [Trichonephila clavipes]|nr:hypothetical protein TNCV_1233181 [Trichonephila clavipes]